MPIILRVVTGGFGTFDQPIGAADRLQKKYMLVDGSRRERLAYFGKTRTIFGNAGMAGIIGAGPAPAGRPGSPVTSLDAVFLER